MMAVMRVLMKVIQSIDDTILHIQIDKWDMISAETLEKLIYEAVGDSKIIDMFYTENPKDFCRDIFILKGEN